MGKLNQVIAVLQGKKTHAERSLTDVHRKIQKGNLLEGISRTYKPHDEHGEQLPSEKKNIQLNVETIIVEISKPLTEWYDIVATQEWANTEARADVLINNEVILNQAPISVLLFLEKRLTDLHTFISKLPTLDPAETWNYDETVDAYRTDSYDTIRTKKIPRNHVLAEATKEHPAQVQMYTEDTPVGTWSTVKFSGAIPAKKQNEMIERVRALQEGVKKAREEANSIAATEKHIGEEILKYIFKP